MQIPKIFDSKLNFWKSYPEFLLIEEFKTFKLEDKDSSQIMWAICLMFHPESNFKNLSYKDREKLICSNLELKKSFKFSDYKDIIKQFEKLTISPAKKHLILWNRIMGERDELLSTLKYDIDNYETIDKMLLNNTKLYSELERITAMLEKEDGDGLVKGGGEESASEKQLL